MCFRGFFIVVHLLFVAQSIQSTYDFELDPRHYTRQEYDRKHMSKKLGFPENAMIIDPKKNRALSVTRVHSTRDHFSSRYAVTGYVLSDKGEHIAQKKVICCDLPGAWKVMHACFVKGDTNSFDRLDSHNNS